MRMVRRRRRRGGGETLPSGARVLVYRWDLDKTYLRSEFGTIRELLRTAFERAEDKVDVPGVAELIRALKPAAERRGCRALIHFVSASPPQIGKAIRAKLDLDRVPYDGIVFKNQLQHLRPGKLHNLRQHAGFKLIELLRGRLDLPREAPEFLFGDDWESDSLIYSLYADVVAGRVGPGRLGPILRRIGVDPVQSEEVLGLAARAAGADVVERIFINLERRTPPADFRLFGRRVVPTFNYLQTAAVLAADGHLDAEDVVRVGGVLCGEAGYTARQIDNSLGDLVRRAHLTSAKAAALRQKLRAAGLLPPAAEPPWRRVVGALKRIRARGREKTEASGRGGSDAAVDYDAILDRLRPATHGGREARS